jgi:peptide chain release factor 2
LIKLGGIFDLEAKDAHLNNLKEQISDPSLWDNNKKTTSIMKEISMCEKDINLRKSLSEKASDIKVMFEFLNDGQIEEKEFSEEIEHLAKLIKEFELKLILNSKNDSKNAIISIHPGAGGTESQDWAQMLYRMYSMWTESKGFKFNVIDFQAGDEAGIKDSTIEIAGDYAYGLLQSEIGVHRLVRISPFDSNSRRHTSFASVSIYPSIDEDVEIEINPKELRIDTFRASGAGGQHVNKTDSAIRITHLPTGTVTQCQTQRSQHKNKEQALKVLKSKLYQLEIEKQEESKKILEGEKKDIAWGNQIRSYVFHPYNMIKDHRTKFEVGNVKAVMDGNIDDFMYSYLLDKMEKNK